MGKIYVNTDAIYNLKYNVNTKGNSCRNCSSRVYTIKNNIDWKVLSRSRINTRLNNLRNRVLRQSELLYAYARVLGTVNSDMSDTDKRLRSDAQRLTCRMNKISRVTTVLQNGSARSKKNWGLDMEEYSFITSLFNGGVLNGAALSTKMLRSYAWDFDSFMSAVSVMGLIGVGRPVALIAVTPTWIMYMMKNSGGNGTYNLDGTNATAKTTDTEPSWFAKFINNQLKTDGDVLYGEKTAMGSIFGIGTGGTIAGSVLHGEAGIKSADSLSFKDKDGNWDFKKAGFSTKAKASGSVVTGEASGNIGYLNGKVSGELLTGGVYGEAKATLYEDGKFNPSLYVGAGAEASAAHGEAEAEFGNDQYGIGVGAEGDLLHAEAEAGAGVGYIGTDKKGNAQYGAKVEASAMASLAEGKVEGGVTVFGIDIDVGVKGYAGAVGVEAGASVTTDGVTGSFGGALAFGGKLDVSVDWSDAEWIGDTVDAVGDFAEDAVDFAGDAIEATGEFFDDVGSFVSSKFAVFN